MSSLRSLAELGEALVATKKKLEQRALSGAYLQSLPRSEAAGSRPFQDVMRRFGRECDIEQQQKAIAVKLVLYDVLQAGGRKFSRLPHRRARDLGSRAGGRKFSRPPHGRARDLRSRAGGKIVLDMPNERRWTQWQKICGELVCVQRMLPENVAAGEQFLRQARAAGHEGLVAKQLASPYGCPSPAVPGANDHAPGEPCSHPEQSSCTPRRQGDHMKHTLQLLHRVARLMCALLTALAVFGCESAATIAPNTPPASVAPATPTAAPIISPAATVGPRIADTPSPSSSAVCTLPALAEPLALTPMPGSVSTPYGIAWLAGRLYVPGRTSNNIGVIDGDKLSQIIALEGMPTQIVADEQLGRLYVVTNNEQAVAMVEASQVRATITVTNPRIANYQSVVSLALDAPHQRLYAAVEADMAGIAIIDTRSFSITRWLEIPGRHFSTRIVIDPSGKTLYVASWDKIEALDVDTGRVVQTTALPSLTYGALTLDPTTGRLFVDQSDGGSLVVAVENGNIVARVPVGAGPHEGLVIGRRLYIASSYSNTVSVIDLDSLGTLATIPVGLSPRALAADPSSASLYVAAGDSFARVAVVDTRTNAVSKLIPLVAQPSQLIADETRKRLYALMPSFNEVLVTDGQRVLSSIPLELAPGQMALDETTGRLYVTDRITSRLSIIDVASGRLIDRRALAVPTPLSSIAVDAPNRRLFVNNDAFALDDLAPQGTYTITMYMYPGEPNLVPYRLIAEPSGQRLYAIAPNGVPGSNGGVVAYAVDSNKRRVLSEFGSINVFALAIDASAQRAYVAASHPIEGLSRVHVYDTKSFTSSVALPMQSLVTALALNPRTNHLFAARTASAARPHVAAIDVLDVRTLGTVTTLPLGADPSEMAILGDRVYIAHRSGRTLSVVRDCAGNPPPAPTVTPTPEPYVTLTSPPSPTPTSTPRLTAAPVATSTPVAACRVSVAAWVRTPANQTFDLRANLGCPVEPPRALQLARENFENGVMFWRADTRQIYVIAATVAWKAYADTWDSAQPEGGTEKPTRPDLRAPKRGFGKVWRERLGGPSAEIGWALDEERALSGEVQNFERGFALRDDAGAVWLLLTDGTWR